MSRNDDHLTVNTPQIL